MKRGVLKASFDRLGRPDAINWVTVVAAVILIVPASFLSSLADFTGREAQFSGIVILRVGVLVAILGAGRAVLVRISREAPQPAWTLLTFAVAIVVSTALFDQMLVFAGFTEESLLSRRLRTTFFGTTLVLVLSSLLVSYARDFSRSNAELRQTIEELQRSRTEVSDRIVARQAELLSTIKNSIHVELAKVLGASPSADKAVMQHLIDDVVRPLSYSLDREFPSEREAAITSPPPPIDWSGVVVSALTANPFRWIATPLAMVVVSASFLIINFGARGLIATLSLLAITSSTFWGLGVAWVSLPTRIPITVRATLFSLAHIPVVMLNALVISGLSGFDLVAPVRLASFLTITLLVSWTLTLVRAALELLRDTNKTLTDAADNLKREFIVTNNSLRQLQRGIARVLHGPVQEAITYAMLSIQSRAQSASPADYANVIRERVSAALELLNQPSSPTTNLPGILNDLEDMWSEVVDVTSVLTPEDAEILAADPTATHALAELVREATSNAIRHGDAKRVIIMLRVSDDHRSVELTVDNDGLPLPDTSHRGMGSALMDEQTLSWSRRQVGALVRVRAVVPLSMS